VKTLFAPLLAVVLNVTDGDTLKVQVPSWTGTPMETISLRIMGIDTPESHMPPGKCALEVERGQEAKAHAQTMAPKGSTVSFQFLGWDKYGGRIDAAVVLPDGQNWAEAMVQAGMARPYDGGRKSDWCR
jgi:micrococcal nuclease